jgi:hypothetical protein
LTRTAGIDPKQSLDQHLLLIQINASHAAEIGYEFKVGGVSIYTNLRGYTEFDSFRRLQGHSIYATVSIPLSALFGGNAR